MDTAVWDTYVTKKNGEVMHFDIVVPSGLKDSEKSMDTDGNISGLKTRKDRH